MAVAYQVAIDGPAASGKSTVARLLARRLGAHYVNTGDMYRAVTWVALEHGLEPATQASDAVRLLPQLRLEHRLTASGELGLVLNGSEVPQECIRAPAVARAVSHIAAVPAVREWLVARQREAARLGVVVMEGRDIGTVVFPQARFKFYVTATAEVRAARRLGQAGETVPGSTVASVAAEIASRDRIDSTRAVAPLRPAPDAVVIDTSHMTLEQVTDCMVREIRKVEPAS